MFQLFFPDMSRCKYSGSSTVYLMSLQIIAVNHVIPSASLCVCVWGTQTTTGVFACSIQQGVPGILMSPALTKTLISYP